MNTEIQKVTRKLESDLNRQVRAANRNQASSIPTITTREQTVLDHWSNVAIDDRPADLFLSHAYADREHAAKTLYEGLLEVGLSVWFSETALRLGVSLGRQIDKALANCSAGLVLVTPAFLTAVESGSWAETELGVLIGSERVIPVLHEVSFEDLKAVSPILAGRTGLSTKEDSFETIANKIAANF